MQYWLMKSEPDAFGIDDLERVGVEPWNGVRNYQARNMMRDQMKVGDPIFFYHSNCDPPGIVGIATVAREAYADPTAWDLNDKYYDPKSSPENPRWLMVDVGFVRKLRRTVTLQELKSNPELDGMPLVRAGNRLSVMPVTAEQWALILALE
ncbi:MAG: EVE domain-containing protein [Thiotrichales bacterium]